MENIVNELGRQALAQPQKAAIIDKAFSFIGYKYRSFSYARLANDVAHAAKILQDRGIKPGDRILVFVPMSYSLYVTLLAIFYTGAVAVFIDAWADKRRLRQACALMQPVGFIGSLKAQLLRVLSDIRKIPIKLTVGSLRTKSSDLPPSSFAGAQRAPDDEALVTMTTGSTGQPKGVKRTYESLNNQARSHQDHLPMAPDDVDLTALPIFVLSNLIQGATSVLPRFNPAKPDRFKPKVILNQIRSCGVTSSIGSPAFFEKLADHMLSENQKTNLNCIYTGGAPVFKTLAIKLKQAFDCSEVFIVYGCSEVEPISKIKVDDVVTSDVALGVPVGAGVTGLEVKLLRPHEEPIILSPQFPITSFESGPGEIGEIILAGSHVVKGYIGDQEATRQNKILEGAKVWHRTGDAGSMDEQGRIYIQGRIKNRMTHDGRTFYPLPFEQKLTELNQVEFSAVLEVEGKAFVIIEALKSSSAEEQKQILQNAKEIMDGISCQYLILDKIPRDPRHRSKVNFEEMKKLIADSHL